MFISPFVYDWIKALHIIAIISWLAGLLYLPRLFIYHCNSKRGSDKSETFKVMERKLLRAIMNPAMFITYLTGVLMIYAYSLNIFLETWFIIKLCCLCALTGIHMCMAKWQKDFEEDTNQKSQLFFRVMNEVPTVLMISIVIMVVVKPL